MRGIGNARGIHMGSEQCTPPGWSHNPSAWAERLPLVALAAVGLSIASYLTLFQVGVTAGVWEPFFGDGSRRILTSGISRTLPIPDAALGAGAYLLDVVSGLVGGRDRWRTMPWMAVIFGLAVGPLGAVSILLVILQPIVYDAWCTLCLTSAVISVIMIGPAMGELLATLQHVVRAGRRGGSRWRAFLGVDDQAGSPRERVPERQARPERDVDPILLGAHATAVVLGLWLMMAPAILGYEGAARTNGRAAGPIMIAVAIISTFGAMRPLRRINVLIALWLAVAPWLLSFTTTARVNTLLVALALLAVSVVGGEDVGSYGGGWRSLWWEPRPGSDRD